MHRRLTVLIETLETNQATILKMQTNGPRISLLNPYQYILKVADR